MNKHQLRNNVGFIPLIGLLVIVIVAIIAAGSIYYFSRTDKTANTNTMAVNYNTTNQNSNVNGGVNENVNSVANANANLNANVNTNTASTIPADWKTYTNNTHHFSIQYPRDWVLSISPSDDSGGILSLVSPSTADLLEEGKIDYGYSQDLVISFWPSINSEFALGGSWVGQRNYSSLEDYFSDPMSPKKRIGSILVSGYPAYKVSIGGDGLNFGVMIEKDGIIELSFPTAWDEAHLTAFQSQILPTFQFIK